MLTVRFGSTAFAAVLMLGISACGSETTTSAPSPASDDTAAADAGDSPTPTDPAATAPTSPPTTTIPPTTAATTTTPPTTVQPETTAPETTVSSGWIEIDVTSVSPKAFPPCCADTWHGEASPALVPAGEPLADGPYAVVMVWPDDPAQPVDLEVFRFEQCALLPTTACEQPPPGFEFSTDDLGIDASTSVPLTVALDEAVRVVVAGWDEARPEPRVIAQGDGARLAALAREVEDAYDAVFATPFAAGDDPSVIIARVQADPASGFSASTTSHDGFVFTPDAGPPLLFQMVFPVVDDQRVAGRGTDVLAIPSIEIVDGQVTVYVFAARQS